MSESKSDAGTVGKFGDVEIHFENIDWLQDYLEKVLAPLEAENAQLTLDLERTCKAWKRCGVLLRLAREKIRRREKARARRLKRGHADEGGMNNEEWLRAYDLGRGEQADEG